MLQITNLYKRLIAYLLINDSDKQTLLGNFKAPSHSLTKHFSFSRNVGT